MSRPVISLADRAGGCNELARCGGCYLLRRGAAVCCTGMASRRRARADRCAVAPVPAGMRVLPHRLSAGSVARRFVASGDGDRSRATTAPTPRSIPRTAKDWCRGSPSTRPRQAHARGAARGSHHAVGVVPARARRDRRSHLEAARRRRVLPIAAPVTRNPNEEISMNATSVSPADAASPVREARPGPGLGCPGAGLPLAPGAEFRGAYFTGRASAGGSCTSRWATRSQAS